MAFSNKESELVVQLPVFANGIRANNALYQVSIPDADACVAAANQFTADYTTWNDPATRTIGSFEQKRASKSSALGICRVFYGQIQRNNGISDADKLLINVTPLSNTRTRRDCPNTSVSVSITA